MRLLVGDVWSRVPPVRARLYATTRFPSGSIGFASAGDPRTAVCMQCDTTVMLTDIPAALQTALRVGAEAETTFAQREAGLYRDGLQVGGWAFCLCCRICSLAFTPMCRRCSSVTRLKELAKTPEAVD